jgi:hypothetical protein
MSHSQTPKILPVDSDWSIFCTAPCQRHLELPKLLKKMRADLKTRKVKTGGRLRDLTHRETKVFVTKSFTFKTNQSRNQSIDMSKPSYRKASLGLLSPPTSPLFHSSDSDLPAKIENQKSKIKNRKLKRQKKKIRPSPPSLVTLLLPPLPPPLPPSLATLGDTFASTPASKKLISEHSN